MRAIGKLFFVIFYVLILPFRIIYAVLKTIFNKMNAVKNAKRNAMKNSLENAALLGIDQLVYSDFVDKCLSRDIPADDIPNIVKSSFELINKSVEMAPKSARNIGRANAVFSIFLNSKLSEIGGKV